MRITPFLLLTVGIAISLEAQTQGLPVATACNTGFSTNVPPVFTPPILSITVAAGQQEFRDLTLQIPAPFTSQGRTILNPQGSAMWSVAQSGQTPSPVGQLSIAPANSAPSSTTRLTMRFPTVGTVDVIVTLNYVLAARPNFDEGSVSCNSRQGIRVTIRNNKPTITEVSPAQFTACTPNDIRVTVSGTGFLSTVAKLYFGNRADNYAEVLPVVESSETRLVRTLRSSVLQAYPGAVNSPNFFVVSNDPSGQVAADLTSDPFYNFTVRPTPRLTGFNPQSVAGGNRTILATGENFTSDTRLILVSTRDGRIERPQALNISGNGFSFFLDEQRLANGGPFTARVVNEEPTNIINPLNVPASYYPDSCSPPQTLNSVIQAIGGPTSVTLSVNSATACGPPFSLNVTAAGVVTTAGQPRLQLNGVASNVSYTSNQFTVPITTSQLGSTAGSLAFSVANLLAPNQFSAAATSNLTIVAPPTITSVPAVSSNGTNQSIAVGVSNLVPTTRILLQRTGQADTVLMETGRTANTVTVTVPGGATGMASPNALRLTAVNADGANPNGSTATATAAGCPAAVNLAVQAQAGAAISQLMPTTELVGRTTDLTVRVLGNNFRTGATVQFNQETPIAGTLVNGGELQVTLPVARFSTTGTIQVRVQNTGGEAVTGTLPFTITAPRTPTFALAATPTTTTSPAVQPTLALTQSNFSERPLTAVFTLEFQPDGATGVSTWPANVAPLFPNNSRTVTVTIPTTGGTVTLPNNGQFSLPFAAGVATARLTSLTVQGTQVSVLPATAVTATTTLSPAAPAVETTVAPLFNRPTPTGNYQVDLNTISNTLSLTSILLRFEVVAGTRVDGNTSFTFDRNNSADLINRIAEFCRTNLATGGQFRLVFPLTISSGDATSITAVNVQFTNSAGQSSETRIARQ